MKRHDDLVYCHGSPTVDSLPLKPGFLKVATQYCREHSLSQGYSQERIGVYLDDTVASLGNSCQFAAAKIF